VHYTQTPLMRYVSHCAANRRVFNADLKLSVLSSGSRRNSGNEYPGDRTGDGESSTTKTCCDDTCPDTISCWWQLADRKRCPAWPVYRLTPKWGGDTIIICP